MDSSKSILNVVKFQVPAGRADSKGALGPILSQVQVNANSFCEEFNDKTCGIDIFGEEPLNVKVILTQYDDKTFSFIVMKPSVSTILRLATGIKQGNSSRIAGFITLDQLVSIAKFKYKDWNLNAACALILGTARSMGLQLKYE